MTDTWTGSYNYLEWLYRAPSRRLRRLYTELEAVEQMIDDVRRSNPVPEHAPSSYGVAIRRRLRPLQAEQMRLQRAIAHLQNDDD